MTVTRQRRDAVEVAEVPSVSMRYCSSARSMMSGSSASHPASGVNGAEVALVGVGESCHSCGFGERRPSATRASSASRAASRCWVSCVAASAKWIHAARRQPSADGWLARRGRAQRVGGGDSAAVVADQDGKDRRLTGTGCEQAATTQPVGEVRDVRGEAGATVVARARGERECADAAAATLGGNAVVNTKPAHGA